jgi:ABC-type branched-subunit amino acid transport system ATPase component
MNPTIIKSIIGLYPSRSGKISFKEMDITSFSPRKKVLSGIGYSPEDTRLFSELTVKENITLKGAKGQDPAVKRILY